MHLDVLGPIVLRDDVREIPVIGVKARQILTVLALSSPATVTLDRLIDLLWVDPPPSAAKTVQAHVARLRRALGDAGASGSLVGGRSGYRLNLGDRIDTCALAQLTARAVVARDGNDAGVAASLFGQARELWRGEPELPDTFAGAALRRRLHDQRLALAIAHLAALIDAGAPDQAVTDLGELVAAEPRNERLWELRTLALYRSGRPTEALLAYDRLRSVLAEEVGALPGPALRNLEAEILAHDTSAS
jgi:DNA-binding SARP family transcriptional activator